MQRMHTEMSRWSEPRSYPLSLVLAVALTILAGCATEGKVKPTPVAQMPSAFKGPLVTRLEDGREGFIIAEVPRMDEASRKDFEQGSPC